MHGHNGRRLRLRRLYRHNPNQLFVVPLDHSLTDGPFATNDDYERIVRDLAAFGADAIVVHKGRLRQISPEIYATVGVFVHVSASTKHAPDPNDKYLVASVEEAVSRGADGISIHINLGCNTEATQLRDFASVGAACEQAGVPLLAMVYARGEQIANHPVRDTLAHAASLAADIGADLVKLLLPNDGEVIRWVTDRAPIPVLAAGGTKLDGDTFFDFVDTVSRSGAGGVAAGRNVFLADDVIATVRRIRSGLDARPASERAWLPPQDDGAGQRAWWPESAPNA